jgi:voltage-gated potassium channel
MTTDSARRHPIRPCPWWSSTIGFTSAPLIQTAPIWLLLLVVISFGLWIGRLEGWKPLASIYFALLITGTVGLGDMRPKSGASRPLTLVIVICGLSMIALLVAAAVSAFSVVLREPPGLLDDKTRIESPIPEQTSVLRPVPIDDQGTVDAS